MQETCLRARVATLDVLSVFTPGPVKSLLLSQVRYGVCPGTKDGTDF